MSAPRLGSGVIELRAASLEATIILAFALLLLLPALLNGFPFVDIDSGAYLRHAVERWWPRDRPVFYSIFALLLHWRISPWPIVIAQALIVAITIWIFLKRVIGIEQPRSCFLIVVPLVLATSLPWYVGYIMPDIFVSMLIIALCILGFSNEKLTLLETVVCLCVISIALLTHYSSLLIAGAALPIFGVAFALGWRPAGSMVAKAAALGAVLILSTGAHFLATYKSSGVFALSPSSSTFRLARLLDDGPALRVLERDCGNENWSICKELPGLSAYRSAQRASAKAETVADYFLWRGPLERLGWFNNELEAEASEIVRRAVHDEPGVILAHAFRHTGEQLVDFGVGKFFDAFPLSGEPYKSLLPVFGEKTAAGYERSVQYRGGWPFQLLNAIYTATVIASLAVVLIWSAKSSKWRNLSFVLLAFMVANAAVCGALSGVFERYQGRVIWLLPLLACAMLTKQLRPGSVEANALRSMPKRETGPFAF